MSEVTRILSAIDQGDAHAAEQLLPLVYDELRRLAEQKLTREKPGQTLQATALVHEAYVRLVEVKEAQHWKSCGHFFGAAAEAMRRILVENARRRKAVRHGGNWQRQDLDLIEPAVAPLTDDLLALDEALDKLAAMDSRKAELVKLRYFAGLTIEQTAEVLGVSVATANRLWNYARAWLHQEIECGESRS
ncbi:MAG TPA: ECF-type sigma factor [Gemmataceae bacterium]|jgi:RNA polymerase sigma factor (TIGR02999 family)|nr:ECF-type sigma factor [Gemmataceae bacterium]